MSYPKTKEEWWQFVDDWWPELMNIMGMFLPIHDNETVTGEDCNLTLIGEFPMLYYIEKNKKERNPALFNYFQRAWASAPDSPHIHNIRGWDILCDLCSESDVLNNP